jgi:hypothetical protein
MDMSWIRVLLVNVGLISIVLIAAEVTARLLEQPATSSVPLVGPDLELGWAPLPDRHSTETTSEFSIEARTNHLGLYGRPVDLDADESRLRILALGDSHAAATGVSPRDAWPGALEALVTDELGLSASVYNAGVGAYSLDQYLVRFRRLAETLDPHVVIIGFSTATDFYDVGRLPNGDFVYGNGVGRIYFELADDGTLVERSHLVGTTFETASVTATPLSITLRSWLNELALYRLFKRSDLALWMATHWSPGGVSLWPGLDTALKLTPNADDQRRLDLAGRLIEQIAEETDALGAQAVLLHIPYLAQVYDDVWRSSFGTALTNTIASSPAGDCRPSPMMRAWSSWMLIRCCATLPPVRDNPCITRVTGIRRRKATGSWQRCWPDRSIRPLC